MIALLGNNRVIGHENKLLWHIPDDLKRFKTLTLGHPVIMGRKTFDSILTSLGKPLPGRTNIVVTRNQVWAHEGVTVAHSLKEAVENAGTLDQEEIFIIGGGQIYERALPLADRLYLTLIDDTKDGDSTFPPYEDIFTKITHKESHEHGSLHYTWIDLEKS